MGNRNEKTLQSFTAYCKAHPEERFWQALRSWSGYNKIFGSLFNAGVDDEVLEDTFYKK